MQNVLERMEAIGAERKMADFNVKMKMDYEFKKKLRLHQGVGILQRVLRQRAELPCIGRRIGQHYAIFVPAEHRNLCTRHQRVPSGGQEYTGST